METGKICPQICPKSPLSLVLKETTQTILKNNEFHVVLCLELNDMCYFSMKDQITDDMLCRYNLGTDFCQGDSLGPFTVEGGGKHGVVSWGFGSARVSILILSCKFGHTGS